MGVTLQHQPIHAHRVEPDAILQRIVPCGNIGVFLAYAFCFDGQTRFRRNPDKSSKIRFALCSTARSELKPFVRFLNQQMPIEKHKVNKKPFRGCQWEIRQQKNKGKTYLTFAMVIGSSQHHSFFNLIGPHVAKQLGYKLPESFKHLCRDLNVPTNEGDFYKRFTQKHVKKINHVVNFLNGEMLKK